MLINYHHVAKYYQNGVLLYPIFTIINNEIAIVMIDGPPRRTSTVHN